jgi:putative ABC transport system permease protein
MDESNLILVSQQWVGAPSGDDPASIQKLDELQREDIEALRAMPDVVSVTPSNSLPLLDSRAGMARLRRSPVRISLKGDARSTYYFGDENFLKTLGLQLVAGRNFTAGDVTNKGLRDPSRTFPGDHDQRACR